MIYYSHAKKVNNTVEGTKTIAEHRKNVKELIKLLFCDSVSFQYDNDFIKSFLKDLSSYHDLGKYTEFFQNYLLGKEYINENDKQHSRIGAFAALKKYNRKYENYNFISFLIYYLIKNHHSNLKCLLDDYLFNDAAQNCVRNIYEKQFNSLKKAFKNGDLNDYPEIGLDSIYPDYLKLRRTLRNYLNNNSNIENYFLINYLFSLLTEADKLDASDTKYYLRKKINIKIVDEYLEKNIKKNSKSDEKSNDLNYLRNYVRENVINKIEENDILNNKLFTLTAPTGIGKTLTALDFAIKLKEKIYEKEKRNAQIIYALPFINIIEQSYEIYSDVLQTDIKLYAHYQYADIFEYDKNFNDEKNYNQKLMELDTWQCDVVITSFVQFFETLIGNRNKLLKKFNHFAGSIIILDEVQSLNLESIPLIGSILYFLTKFLDARILLMTATKPKLFELANEHILKSENENASSKELLDDYISIYNKFDRTKIIPLITEVIDDNKFINEFLLKYWDAENKSCLIVVNTVNRSLKLYGLIKEIIEKSKRNNKIYYLSTNIIPANRLKIIKDIKSDIEKNENPILISTQCIEAGVDLDFDIAFRDIAPVDSIIQVAGRVNRNNFPERQESPIYIVDFGDCQKIYGTITYTQSKNVFQKGLSNSLNEITEKNYLELIEKYFSIRDGSSSFEYSRNIFSSMKNLKYESKDDYSISDFKIIKDNYYTKAVFIEIDKTAVIAKEKYLKLIKKEISREDFEPYKKDFNQRIIAVPCYYTIALEQEGKYSKLSDNLMIVRNELISNYYDNETGFKRIINNEEINKMCMF